MGIMRAIADTDLTVVSASGGGDQWSFELRAMDAEHLAAFQEFCATNDIPVQFRRLHRLSEAPQGEYGLTNAQQEALALAFKRGYYESPAEVSLDALGAELGITGQSMGSRLRRGVRTLIASTVVDST
jgi:predicted DNA binding protein